MEIDNLFRYIVGIILAGGGILMFCGAFAQRRGTPVRSFIGLVVAAAVTLVGLMLLIRPNLIFGLFRSIRP